jgi:hypothetical protein
MARLGLPFIACAAVLAPLAYYPTFLQMGDQPTSFVSQWLSLGSWPAGPAWFLWVLLAFGCVAALVHTVAPRLSLPLGRLGERPILFFAALTAISAVAYVPMAAAFTPFDR